MKRLKTILLIVLSSCLLMAFSSISRKFRKQVSVVELPTKPLVIIVDTPTIEMKKVVIAKNTHKDFL